MYTVQWARSALDKLAKEWINADSTGRWAITHAIGQIDDELQLAPHHVGESRPTGRRIIFVAPLGVVYKVISEDRIVHVLDVWRFQTR